MIRHYLLTGFLVWIVPVGMSAFLVIAILLAVFFGGGKLMISSTSSTSQWTIDMLGIWVFVSTFPSNIFGRMLPMGFMAAILAGEYQWGTWKNVIPRTQRTRLIIAKFAAMTALVMLSLLITSLLVGILESIAHKIAGLPYGPALSWQVIREYFPDYFFNMLMAWMALLTIAGFAALAALITRSVLGGLLAGFGFSVLDPVSIMVLFLIGNLFDKPELVNLYRFTSTYNLDNIRSWLFENQAVIGPTPGFTASHTLGQSSVLMAIWIFGLLSLAILIFNRQDITS